MCYRIVKTKLEIDLARESKQKKVNWLLLYFLLAVEKMFVSLADTVVTLSTDDKRVIDSWGVSPSKTKVVPLSIDLKRVEERARLRGRREKEFHRLEALKASGTKIIVFHGLLSYWPNEFASRYIVNELAPRVSKKHNDVVFVIVGAHPPEDLVKKCDKVIFTGFVPTSSTISS